MFLSAAGLQLFKFQKWPNAAHRAEERSDTSHYVVTMWSQSCVKVVSRLSQSCPKIVSKPSAPKLSKVAPKFFQECLKVGSKVFPFLAVDTFSNCTLLHLVNFPNPLSK